jgi:hypothetical protein
MENQLLLPSLQWGPHWLVLGSVGWVNEPGEVVWVVGAEEEGVFRTSH